MLISDVAVWSMYQKFSTQLKTFKPKIETHLRLPHFGDARFYDIRTLASRSKLPNNSLRTVTSSCAVHWEDILVKPTISANRMLEWWKNVWIKINNIPNKQRNTCTVTCNNSKRCNRARIGNFFRGVINWNILIN